MVPAKHVMRIFPAAISVALLLAPSFVRGDATIRYKTEVTSALPFPATELTGITYMKGNKGATVSSGEIIVADFVKNEITLIDTERKRYVTIPASEFATRMAEMMPKADTADGQIPGSPQTKCDSHKTGRTEVIQGVQAEEREQTCWQEIKLTEGTQQEPAAVADLGGKFVTHVWSASPSERARVPALWQLSGYELWQKYFMNPTQTEDRIMGGMSSMMEDLQPDQSAILRLTMEMYMKTPPPGVTTTASEPTMKMTQEIVELSTAPLDDSLFQVPADYAATTFGDFTNGMRQALTKSATAAKPPATQPGPAIPANVKAYVPSLNPLSRTEPDGSYETDGSVELLVSVGPKGTVESAEVLSGPEPLRNAALNQVRNWTFRPVLRDGAPVTAYTDTSVYFIDPKRTGPPSGQFSPDMAASWTRKMQLEQAFPRSPQQVLADLEQDSLGGDKDRRFYALSDLEYFALQAGAYDKAADYAHELLSDAEQKKEGWNYGNAIHNGHATLGLLALRSDDIATARLELLEAGKTPGSPQLNSFGPGMTLANELLKRGEREAVLEYFALCRKFWKLGRSQLDAWSDAVRKGETPVFGGNLNLH